MLFREALPFPEISFFCMIGSLLHVAHSLSRSAAADKFFVRTSFLMAEAAISSFRVAEFRQYAEIKNSFSHY